MTKKIIHKFFTLVIIFLIIGLSSFAQTIFSIRADGVVLKNNVPFFPVGFYIDRGTVSYYTSEVQAIANGGNFNVINLPYVGGNDAAWNAFLDVCYSKNIYVITQLDYTGNFTAPILTFKNHPAVIGWSVADDADNNTFTIAQLQARHNQIKTADPNHITDMSLTGYYPVRRAAANSYTSIPDVPSFQIYPISPLSDYDVTPSNALTQTYLRTLLYVNSAALANKALIMNNQVFNWAVIGSTINPRFPTAAEGRNMTYAGLAAGVKGFISYVHNQALEAEVGLWNETKALRNDINALENVLLNGTLTRINTGDAELVCSRWEYENNCYLIVVNTSYTNAKNISVAIPTSYNGQAQSLFSRMSNTLSKVNNNLIGNIAGNDVQVYKITTGDGNLNTYVPDDTTNFTNPDRGWHIQFETCNDVNEALNEGNLLSTRINAKISLVKKNYNLRLYKNAPIAQSFLTLLQNDFTACRNAGLKLIPLFRYNACEGQPAPNAPIERILEHMDQLGPILTANKDVIAWMKAGFIGAYGEWQNADDPTLLQMPKKGQILNKLLSVLPSDRMVNIRFARDKREIYNQIPITLAEAHGGTNKARVGHENDSFGSNAIDYGTYYFGEAGSQAEDIALVKNFLEQENKYLSQGGETSGLCGLFAGDSIYRKCDYALLTMKRLKYSSISHYELFDVNAPCNTIPIWGAAGCEPEMRVKLGYRFKLLSASIPNSVSTAAALQISFSIANDGWANPINPRGVRIVLRNKITNEEFFVPITDGLSVPSDRSIDPRFWNTNTTTIVNINKPLPSNIPAGNYEVLLHLFAPEASIKSRPEYAIRLANQNIWEPSTGYNSFKDSIQIFSTVLALETDIIPQKANPKVQPISVSPNPATNNTHLNYTLPQSSIVKVDLIDLQGRLIQNILTRKQPKGQQTVLINTASLANGVYIINFTINEKRISQKLVVSR